MSSRVQGNWLLIGLGLGVTWLLWRNANAAEAIARPVMPSGMPTPGPQESSEELMDRIEAWGMKTGSAFPTMDGYGAGAMDAWNARPVYGGYG